MSRVEPSFSDQPNVPRVANLPVEPKAPAQPTKYGFFTSLALVLCWVSIIVGVLCLGFGITELENSGWLGASLITWGISAILAPIPLGVLVEISCKLSSRVS